MRIKKLISFLLIFIIIPSIVIIGAVLFKDKYYAWLSLAIAVVACMPLFYAFERHKISSIELTVVAVMITISVVGRFIFAWIPGFKPITAITIISGVYLGRESGFIVGAISAVVSNFYFGQGPWTPFQMFIWGVIGYISGVLSRSLNKSRFILCLFGAFSGIAYSLCMDVWTTVWADGAFNFSRYFASVLLAMPSTVEYMLSNVVFLFILEKPFGEKLTRIKKKFGLFINS